MTTPTDLEGVLRADRIRTYHAPLFHDGPMPTCVRTRAETNDDGEDAPSRPTLFGVFARFDEWNEIRSPIEGHFLERVAPGAFDETFAEYGPQGRGWIRAIFDHGHDPHIGMKPIGVPTVLEARAEGAYYEVPLFDSVPALLVDGLRSGAYGASYRFNVARDDELVDLDPDPSEHNPRGIPEVTIQRATIKEIGPTALGADPFATAGVRSDTELYNTLSSPTRSSAELGDEAQSTDNPESPIRGLAERQAFLRIRTIEGIRNG